MKCIYYSVRKIFIIVIVFNLLISGCTNNKSKPGWPEISNENKPWTRWWWFGNILDEQELSKAIKEYADAGLGGLEITPIYGVKGYEEKFINYLSDEWVNKLLFTLSEAEKNGLKIDMATGTGWPFGGPWVTRNDACKYMAHKIYQVQGGESLNEKIQYIQRPILRTIGKRMKMENVIDPIAKNDSLQQIAFEQVRFEKPLPLVVLMAYGENGEKLNLTDKVTNGTLDWVAPEGDWKLYAIFQGWHGKIVERAAPGGEGDIIDHFSKKALDNYLKRFDEVFIGKDISSIRAFFNDSYEVDDAIGEADFTPALFDEFIKRRGYDLREYFPALFGYDTISDINRRVIVDYRQTISELLLENFTIPWGQWAKKKNAIIRNQAHGSPANILDLYAAVDIPETEGDDLIRIKFASSAANVTGKKLTSSESATWLNEHFLATLEETKENIDRYFLGGVNHIFYHGTPFSPSNAEWPGFMFYASVHYAPTNTFWDDFKTLNLYVARCQSFLQAGKPDNDILVYFPFYDRISITNNYLLQHFSGGGLRGIETNFRKLVREIIASGYSLDYISDKQLLEVNVKNNMMNIGGNSYKVIIVPECKFVPLETLNKLVDLASKGAKIIFYNNLPKDVPGFNNLDQNKRLLKKVINSLEFNSLENQSISVANIDKGNILVGNDLEQLLKSSGVSPEDMVKNNLNNIRRKNKDGYTYFIVNKNKISINGWVNLDINAESVIIFNPITGKFGQAGMKEKEDGKVQVYLQLNPGQSCILKTYNKKVECSKYKYIRSNSEEIAINGPWELSFIKGGPVLPYNESLSILKSWTDLGNDDTKAFSGIGKYTTNFSKPVDEVHAWLLDLGRVCESARIILNGEELGTLFSQPYQLIIPLDKLKESNKLEVLVSNLMINRIIYMEKNGLIYKRFYNVNFPARRRENRGEDGLFTSKNIQPQESGLIGPVTLTGINYVEY